MASSGQSSGNDPPENAQGQVSKNEVEMNDLNTRNQKRTADSQVVGHPDILLATSSSSAMGQPSSLTADTEPASGSKTEPTPAGLSEDTLSSGAPRISSSTAPDLNILDSVAIDPSVDQGLAPAPTVDPKSPVCTIMLLLTSGARHPYKLDEKYLTKRNVTMPGVTESGKKDPFSISVYTLKELILREWREEWEAQPSSPSSIRLIHFGRLLDDKTPLKECRFNADTPNVVHMTVRPQEVVDDEEASKSKALRGERDGTERTPGCRCVIL